MIPAEYVLIWSDEFEGTILDTAKWFKSSSSCDYALIPANVTLDGNSNVVFTCSNPTDGGGIASACDNTGEVKFDFKYGYLEVRAKLADTNQITGIGSDIWMNGSAHWPPEIDITETGSGPMNQDAGINQMNMTIWYGSGSNPSSTEAHTFIHDANGNPVDLGKDFHIYGMEWTSTFVRFLLDGVEQARMTSGIPQDPMYITSSIYPGGFLGKVQPDTPFPTYMYIDYVRVYQKGSQTLSSIGISPTSASVNVGKTAQLSATCKDQNNNAMTCPSLAWLSSNTVIAKINSNGLVTGDSPGNANITASASGITSNVSNINVTSIGSMQLSLPIKIGTSTQLIVKCFDKNNSGITCPAIAWSSSNNSVAIVSSTGVVKGISTGVVNITASALGVTSNKFIITVT